MAEGYTVVGFDNERHRYPKVIRRESSVKLPGNNGGAGAKTWSERPIARLNDANDGLEVLNEWMEYPAQLVLQDVLTLHGRQFKSAALIVASPPCQAYSYRAMPWKRAKALPPPSNELFDACFRIQREACEAAGHHIPLVVENVCGAQKWVGRARWHYGSFYLWGDVPALMPITMRAVKVAGLNWSGSDKPGSVAKAFNSTAEERLKATKNDGGSWFNVAHNTTSGHGQNPDGRKTTRHLNKRDGHDYTRHLTNPAEHRKNGGDWFGSGSDCSLQRRQASKSSARKAASAHIAKIPYQLSRWIARAWKPLEQTA